MYPHFPEMVFRVALPIFSFDDVDTLHAEFVKRGVRISLEPTDQTWGNREMYVEDPEGNKIRFTREDES